MKYGQGYEMGKDTEKAVKRFLGLPSVVSGAGEIDAVYNDHTIEIKRGDAKLYSVNADNSINPKHLMTYLIADALERRGTTALLKSDYLAYSIDGTAENTYILSVVLFLEMVSVYKVYYLTKEYKGKRTLRIVAQKNPAFIQNLKLYATRLDRWKAQQDARP